MFEYVRSNHRILLVDNDTIQRAFIKKILESRAMIDICTNAIDALTKIHNENIYDLIITDINMPFFNGIELAKICNFYFQKLPFIIICDQNFYIQKKENIFNIKAFIHKPLKENILRGFVDGIIFGMI